MNPDELPSALRSLNDAEAADVGLMATEVARLSVQIADIARMLMTDQEKLAELALEANKAEAIERAKAAKGAYYSHLSQCAICQKPAMHRFKDGACVERNELAVALVHANSAMRYAR